MSMDLSIKIVSPFTGGDVKLEQEHRDFQYRKDTFKTLYRFYVCVDTGEQFTTTDLDEFNMNHVYNEYRAKHGIPFVEEIKEIRERYELSAAKMSKVLGFGTNIYRAYENGEMPSVANGRLIQMARDPKEFRKLLNLCSNEFTADELDKIHKKIDHFSNGWNRVTEKFEEMVLGPKKPNIYNGYKNPDIHKVGHIVQYFSKEIKPFKTKLNKLLFYVDFLHYNKTGYGVTGLMYKAIQHGPVPNNYGTIYDRILELNYAKLFFYEFENGIEGEKFVSDNESEIDLKLFSKSEIETIKEVALRFGKMSTKQIVDFSHEEAAWKINVDEHNRINYEYGFYLNTD